MQNHFLLPTDRVRKSWKLLRESLGNQLSDQEQIIATIDWWKSAPFGKPYLDYLSPKTWPNPWSLIDIGIYDQSSVSLGIYYTLMLAADGRWKSPKLKLCMLRSRNACHESLSCIIDTKYLVGFEFGRMTDLQNLDDINILHSYNYDTVQRCMVESKSNDFQ